MSRTIGLMMLAAFVGLSVYGLIRIMGVRDFFLYEVCGAGGIVIYLATSAWLITKGKSAK